MRVRASLILPLGSEFSLVLLHNWRNKSVFMRAGIISVVQYLHDVVHNRGLGRLRAGKDR